MKGLIILSVLALLCVNLSNADSLLFCLEPENQGRNIWHESDCTRYYRCWLGIAHPLVCPSGIAPRFDSCRSACVSDPFPVCGDPGSLCPDVGTSTTGSTTSLPGEPSEPTEPGDTTVPTAPTVTPTPPTIGPLIK